MLTTATAPVTRNLIVDYYEVIASAAARLGAGPGGPAGTATFGPGFDLPELSAQWREFFGAATATWRELGAYGGHGLQFMDLTGNPGTNTTKTFPSMLIVARAVEHIRRTGESICIFTPTSANKGIALRDAVGRAIAAGLVTPEQLRVVVLAPGSTRHKFRRDPLSADPALRAANPLLRFTGDQSEGVKALGRAFVDAYAQEAYNKHGTALWFSLALPNYLVADAARAAFELDAAQAVAAAPRWHAHAVSSAFGLLGYNLGRDLLEASGRADGSPRPGFLLVQHLGTPDMVLNLRHGTFSRDRLPAYRRDAAGVWSQDADPHFPAVTDDPDEVLDPTFYTHQPVTSPAMNDLIAAYGGDGITVSRRECLQRYPQLREWLRNTGCELPADPADLREWSIVMALTGVLNAIDRGLVPAGREIVVHGSGSYRDDHYAVYEPDAEVSTVEEIASAVLGGR
ncbi:hypothetical protein Cs7R123_46080 [Catellatospora sp. TT07R-123]|uniref:DUF6002 family protein n=1 Tax=Catellatospora sp. TT07R-123 TaxID=2733863 RepID=UPI001B0A5FD9|nr:DUF6002 family protein [Catellatospora sp. TT07R-123]GHJ47266.1 hypothetical protein Cs7R123_46080 [Catellatospora sp. TT07R-123]